MKLLLAYLFIFGVGAEVFKIDLSRIETTPEMKRKS
jgi:hypothetical protein